MRTLPLTLFFALLLAAPPPVEAAARLRVQAVPLQAGPVSVEAEEIAYDAATRIVTARGRVRVTHPRFTLFADVLTFDLDRQVITAEGRVRVVEVEGRELRGARIVYDVGRRTGVLSGAETIVDGVYLRGESIQISPDRLVIEGGTATPCDPRDPLYRVTARRIEVIPGEAAVAEGATLWLGSFRLITLERYRISLAPGAQRAPLLPGFGVNQTDGIWADLRLPYRLGESGGELFLKYGQLTGLFALNTLQLDRPGGSLTLRLGRTQKELESGVLQAFTQAQAIGALSPRPLAPGVHGSASLAFGWFQETDSGISTTRLDGTATLSTDPLPLGRRLSVSAFLSGRYSAYGTGHRRQVLSGAAELAYRIDEATSASVRYDLVTQWGGTPFIFDGVTPASAVSLNLARSTSDYRFNAGVSHDVIVPETKLRAGAGVRLSPSLSLDVDVVYNTRIRAWEDIDYTLTYRCDCLSVVLRHRQVRGEWSIAVSLPVSDRVGFTQPAP